MSYTGDGGRDKGKTDTGAGVLVQSWVSGKGMLDLEARRGRGRSSVSLLVSLTCEAGTFLMNTCFHWRL